MAHCFKGKKPASPKKAGAKSCCKSGRCKKCSAKKTPRRKRGG